jgi:hypothetical protein
VQSLRARMRRLACTGAEAPSAGIALQSAEGMHRNAEAAQRTLGRFTRYHLTIRLQILGQERILKNLGPKPRGRRVILWTSVQIAGFQRSPPKMATKFSLALDSQSPENEQNLG